MVAKIFALAAVGAGMIGTAACGGDSTSASAPKNASVSGRYIGDVPDFGASMNIEFQKNGEAVLTMVGETTRTDVDCTYQSGERTIALSCLGSSGITLTPLSGGDLEADVDGLIVRFVKQ